MILFENKINSVKYVVMFAVCVYRLCKTAVAIDDNCCKSTCVNFNFESFLSAYLAWTMVRIFEVLVQVMGQGTILMSMEWVYITI